MKLPATCYCVVNLANEPLGVDDASGGYPWVPSTLSGIRFWSKASDAHHYVDAFRTTQPCEWKPIAVAQVTVKFGI